MQFKTPADTYVVSENASSRKIEKVIDEDKLKPSADRLKFYDLPEMWKSSKYFTRLGQNTAKIFEQFTLVEMLSISPDRPLRFCLDDIVLTDAKLNKHLLGTHELVTIFFHQFKSRF